MIKSYCKPLIVLVMFSSSLLAQSNNTAPLVNPGPPVSTLIAVLTGSLESRSATAGQKFTLRAISDVVVDGQLVLPKGSRVLGHVTEAVTKDKDQPHSELWVVIEKAVRRDGSEVPLQAIIAALHAPQNNNSLSDDPTYGMMHSQEPAQVGATAAAASKASSTAAVATADFKGGVDERSLFDENSRGAIGYKDLSLAWHLMVPPPITVITSKGKNVKLRSGTQMLLRMAPPRIPR
ncbi:MAG: hypothetical protein M3539_04585 [Acidobacteriota bacterium]|nr:hypothetical protein [Acidobacteriota bacterium]